MRNLLRGLDYSVLASTLALFVALGGTSYAAGKITGASIKDNSVTGKDVATAAWWPPTSGPARSRPDPRASSRDRT